MRRGGARLFFAESIPIDRAARFIREWRVFREADRSAEIDPRTQRDIPRNLAAIFRRGNKSERSRGNAFSDSSRDTREPGIFARLKVNEIRTMVNVPITRRVDLIARSETPLSPRFLEKNGPRLRSIANRRIEFASSSLLLHNGSATSVG